MKIAATVVDSKQVGVDSFRDIKVTKIFDSSQSVDEMIAWAKTLSDRFDFHSLELSEVQP